MIALNDNQWKAWEELSIIPPGQENCHSTVLMSIVAMCQMCRQCVFILLPGVVHKSEFISAVVIHMPL